MQVMAPDSLLAQLENLGAGFEDMAKEAVTAGAGILADEVRKNLERNLAGSDYSTGDLLDALGVAPARANPDGTVDAKVGFDQPGYDRKGVPNILKARVMESGSSKQQKCPFFRPAYNAAKGQVVAAMQQKISEKMKE